MGCELGDEAEGPEGLALSQCFPQGCALACGVTGDVSVGPHCEGVALSNVIARRWAPRLGYAGNAFLDPVKGDRSYLIFFFLQTVVRVQGEDFLMPVSDVEMLGFEVSEGHNEGGGAREPQSAVSVVPPDDGQQESQDGQHLPGAKDLSRGQVSVMS